MEAGLDLTNTFLSHLNTYMYKKKKAGLPPHISTYKSQVNRPLS
jgi:hypothetical protein